MDANVILKDQICVSCRELPPLTDTFSPNQRLRLHTLTKHDQQTLVDAKLGSNLNVVAMRKSEEDKCKMLIFV
jgi:hypothetical protein